MKQKIVTYALLALCLFLGVQYLFLWIKGVEYSPVQSIYRTKPKPQIITPQAPQKGERVVTLPCTRVEVLSPVSSQPDALETQSFTLGRWDIPFSRRGGVAEVTLDKDSGKPSLTFTPKAMGLVEMGRSRYATLWGDYSINSESEKKWLLSLEAEVDAFRVGPLWTRARGGVYYANTTLPTNEKVNDVGVKVGLGLGVAW